MKSLKNKIYLKTKLYGMIMKYRKKIANHFNVFNTLIFELTIMDVKIDDEDKEVNLLCTLPRSSGQVVSSIVLSTN